MSGQVRLVRPLGSTLAVLLLAGPLAGFAPAGAEVRGAPARCAPEVVPDGADGAGDDGADGADGGEDAVRVDVQGIEGVRGSGLRRDAVRFARRGQPAGAVRVSPTWLEVPGQGTWTVDAGSGDVVLTPADETDDEAVVFAPEDKYGVGEASDDTSSGAPSDEAEAPAPVLVAPCDALGLPDSDETDQGVGVALRPLDNDIPGSAADGGRASFEGSRIGFDDDALPDGARLTDGDRRLSVADEGVWTLGAAGRTATFVPAAGFTGHTTPVRYAAKDSAGHRLSSTMRVEVGSVSPSAEPDTARTTQATPVAVDVLANDDAGADSAPLDPDTLRLSDDEDRVEALDVDGEGSWSVADGELEFTPDADFTGTTTPVGYSVADGNGTRAASTAQVAVAAAQAAPLVVEAVNDRVTAPFGTEVRVPVLENDEPQRVRLRGTVTLIENPGEDDEKPVRRLVVAGEGVWRIVDRELAFRPEKNFSGVASPVTYRAASVSGLQADRAKVFLTIEEPVVVKSTEVTTTSDKAVTAKVLDAFEVPDSITLQPGTVCVFPGKVRVDGKKLSTDAKNADRCLDDHARPSVGRWELDDNGDITFTPRAGFTGRAAIGWRVRSTQGSFYRTTLAVEVTAPRVPTVTTPPPAAGGQGYTTTPTSGGALPDTGGPTFLALLAGLVLVGAGGVVVRRSRRTS